MWYLCGMVAVWWCGSGMMVCCTCGGGKYQWRQDVIVSSGMEVSYMCWKGFMADLWRGSVYRCSGETKEDMEWYYSSGEGMK